MKRAVGEFGRHPTQEKAQLFFQRGVGHEFLRQPMRVVIQAGGRQENPVHAEGRRQLVLDEDFAVVERDHRDPMRLGDLMGDPSPPLDHGGAPNRVQRPPHVDDQAGHVAERRELRGQFAEDGLAGGFRRFGQRARVGQPVCGANHRQQLRVQGHEVAARLVEPGGERLPEEGRVGGKAEQSRVDARPGSTFIRAAHAFPLGRVFDARPLSTKQKPNHKG